LRNCLRRQDDHIKRTCKKACGFLLYCEDASYTANKQIADAAYQPAMTTEFPSWENYFNRPYKQYQKWLNDSSNERIPMTLIELIKLAENQKVVVDMMMPIKTAMSITDYNRIAFLVAVPDMVTKDYYLRPDHIDLYNCIMSLEEPKKALENCNKTLAYGTRLFLDELYKSDVFYLRREAGRTIEETLMKVEAHFGLA
jgi:hypothetical protein